MPPAEENRVFALLGMLQGQLTSLDEKISARIDTLEQSTTAEHRKVHDIVDAMSESVRNIDRSVTEMKPHVEAYKMKAKDIDEAVELTEGYKLEQAEKRGADKFKGTLYGLWAGFGALVIFLLGKAWDAIQAAMSIGKPPHPVVAVLLLVMSTQALARDDGRHVNSPLKDWVRGLKDKNGQGCCDTADGFPAEVEWDTEREHYRVRIDGVWYVVPPSAVLDQPNKLGYPMVWYWRQQGVPQIRCFIPGAGG